LLLLTRESRGQAHKREETILIFTVTKKLIAALPAKKFNQGMFLM
jgi:hypothetical protein